MISVIIPVYNVAPYLPACLDSVLAQSYTDIEVILVDDGSTDDSREVCNDYACRDARVTVLCQPNQGASAARNRGLNEAKGAFVTFIDADDVVHHRYLEVMLEVMQRYEADIVQSPYLIVDSRCRKDYTPERLSQAVSLSNEVRSYDADGALLSMLYQQEGGVNSSPCKLFRTSLFNECRFPEQYRVYEDLYLMAHLYQHIVRLVCIKEPLYYYFKDNTGTLNSQSIRRLDAFDALETLEAQFLVQGKHTWYRAARERRLSVSFNVLRLLSAQPHTDLNKAMAHRCWQHIKALRAESIRDPKARFKNRLFAAFSYLLVRSR